jgi:O-antigen/teichoic acid export membrane protein
MVAQLLGFLAIVYLARVLGPGDFGKLNFAIAIITYFILFANLGLPLLGTRQIARDRENIDNNLANILTMRLFLAALSFGLLFLMVFFLNKPLEIKYLIILYGLGIIPSALLLDWAFQGIEKMEYIGIGRILGSVIYVGLALMFVKGQQQLLLVPCFQVSANLLVAVLLIFIFVNHFGKPRFRIKISTLKEFIKSALPIGFSILMIQIVHYIDTLMLGFMKSTEQVGHYSAAYKIIMILLTAVWCYQDAVFPVISNYYKTSLDSLKKIQSYSTKVMLTLTLPLSIGGTILAKPIMHLIYGGKYAPGVVALQILIWTVVVGSLHGVYVRGLIACDRQNKRLIIAIVHAFIVIALNFVFIPLFGLIGAAIVTVSAEFLVIFLSYREFSKIVRVPFHSYIFKPLFASSIMVLFLYWGLKWLNFNLFLSIFGGGMIYFISLYLMRGITSEDIRIIQYAIITNKEGN